MTGGLSEILTTISDVFSTIMSSISDVINVIVENPILLLGVGISFAGVIVGFARSFLRRG